MSNENISTQLKKQEFEEDKEIKGDEDYQKIQKIKMKK